MTDRAKPVSLSSELKILDGNFVLFDESKLPIWSTNVNSTASRSVQAVHLYIENLLSIDGSNSTNPLWQSFDYPTHIWLPGGKIGYNKATKRCQVLTSWKNTEDPAPASSLLSLTLSDISFNIKWNGSKIYWTSGSWVGKIFSNLRKMRIRYFYVFSFESNETENYFTYSLKI